MICFVSWANWGNWVKTWGYSDQRALIVVDFLILATTLC